MDDLLQVWGKCLHAHGIVLYFICFYTFSIAEVCQILFLIVHVFTVDPTLNQAYPTEAELPQQLKDMITAENKKEKEKEEKEKIERETYNVHVHFKGAEKVLSIHKSVSLRDALVDTLFFKFYSCSSKQPNFLASKYVL